LTKAKIAPPIHNNPEIISITGKTGNFLPVSAASEDELGAGFNSFLNPKTKFSTGPASCARFVWVGWEVGVLVEVATGVGLALSVAEGVGVLGAGFNSFLNPKTKFSTGPASCARFVWVGWEVGVLVKVATGVGLALSVAEGVGVDVGAGVGVLVGVEVGVGVEAGVGVEQGFNVPPELSDPSVATENRSNLSSLACPSDKLPIDCVLPSFGLQIPPLLP